MSSDTAVVARGLGKDYRVGGANAYGYTTLREAVMNTLTAPVRKIRGQRTADQEDPDWLLRALDEVDFRINPGEAVGFVGRNGAGKSTLLKVLSRVTEPTRGFAEVTGRVGSLLEVGTGFHPELTGRENIYLNGAILGMGRREIARRFDEIVAFADVERFLDTPVKRYSSGMFVRLAFSVAAHLEPEILIIDEVLAVGDAAFQRKSLGRMGNIAREGRTVLFVSHNMAVIQALCTRGILLDGGRVVADGSIADTVTAYLRTIEGAASAPLEERTDRRGWQQSRVVDLRIDGGTETVVRTGGPARITVVLNHLEARTSVSLTLHDQLGIPVCVLDSGHVAPVDTVTPHGEPVFVAEVPTMTLLPGRYRVDVTVRGGGHLQDELLAAANVDVTEGLLGTRPVGGGGLGTLALEHQWSVPES